MEILLAAGCHPGVKKERSRWCKKARPLKDEPAIHKPMVPPYLNREPGSLLRKRQHAFCP